MTKLDFSQDIISTFNILHKCKNNWEKDVLSFIQEWTNEKEYIIAQTSGTSGKSKSIFLHKKHVINSARATISFFGLKKGDNALLCISPQFIAGKLMIIRAITCKMILYIVEPSSNPMKEIPKNIHLDFVAMVPLQLGNSIKKIHKGVVAKIIVGGASISKKLMSEIKHVDVDIYATYGMTETITHVAIKKLNGNDCNRNFNALDDVFFKQNKDNCLVISAKNVSEKEIITNDIIELINETEFKWLGRLDNVINSGGIKISPESLEGILSKYISNNFFISSIPDDVFGEKLILIVEGNTLDISMDKVKSLLPKYHNPKEVFFLDEFTYTDSGKIQRKKTLKIII